MPKGVTFETVHPIFWPFLRFLTDFSNSAEVTEVFCEKMTFLASLFSSITETLIDLPGSTSWTPAPRNETWEFGKKPEMPSFVDTRKPPLVTSSIFASICSFVFKSELSFSQTLSSLKRLKETTGFPRSDSGFKTETDTLSPTLTVERRLFKILLSFSKTTASVFAPISTRISEEVSFVTIPSKISPFLGLTNEVETDFIKSAIVVAFLVDAEFATHLITFLF